MVSIVIRTYNEEKHLGEILEKISKQSYKNYEVIIVDSGSTDNTIDIASKFNFVKIINIKKEDFTFGYSLNVGIENSNGEFIIMISGHCIPVDDNWIKNIIRPFENNDVGISYGRQIGTKDTKFSEHSIFETWFPNVSDYNQKNIPFCNNANCSIRKSIWLELGGYDETAPGLEDILLARIMLSKTSYHLAYESEASVYHIHEENWKQIRNRYYRESITYSSMNIGESFTIIDFVNISYLNIIHDIKKLIKHKDYKIRTVLSIFSFRLNQFWGTYKGYKYTRKYNELRKKFYYPI